MAGHVHNGLLVGGSAVVNNQLVILAEAILDGHLQLAGESFLVISRNVAENQFAIVNLFCIPNTCMETSGTSVQMVGTIVDSKVVFLTVHNKLSLADTVAVTANQGAEEWLGAIDNTLDTVMSLYNIGHLAFLIWNHDGH